jgi:tetratricopeptide (TPR) repeat protein
MKRYIPFALVVALGAVSVHAGLVPEAATRNKLIEDVPDAGAVRRQIDTGIKSFQRQKKKATLGMIQQSIALSISYGAPAYNAGDHGACYHFYADTADALVTAFADENSATHAGWKALNDLRIARDRTKQSKDADRNAWTMRYAFDKTQLAVELEIGSATGLMRLGAQNFQQSHFNEAQDAYESSERSLHELEGQPLELIPIGVRFAPLALANSLFAQKQYKSAADAVVDGLRALPEWPGITLDLRSLHHDPAEYESLIEDLQAKIKATPADPALPFLLGYEYFFTGKKSAARGQFDQTLKLDPKHAGANLFLHPGQKPDDGSNPVRPPIGTGAVKT